MIRELSEYVCEIFLMAVKLLEIPVLQGQLSSPLSQQEITAYFLCYLPLNEMVYVDRKTGPKRLMSQNE